MNPIDEPVDMSPEAVFRRLEQMGHRHEHGISLRNARCLGRAEVESAPEIAAPPQDDDAIQIRAGSFSDSSSRKSVADASGSEIAESQ